MSLTLSTAPSLPVPDLVHLAGPAAGLLMLLAIASPVLAGLGVAGLLGINLVLWLTAPSPGLSRDRASPAAALRS